MTPELEVTRLRLGPGDMLIFKVRERIPASAAAALRETIQASLPDGVRFMIVDGSIESIMVLESEAA
jgi:hypothetical protein